MYHPTLTQRAEQFLSPAQLEDPAIRRFLESVSASLANCDQQRAAMKHKYVESQQEYETINRELNRLADQRLRSLKQLNKAVSELIGAEISEEMEGDLVAISEDIRGRVHVNAIVKDELNRNINLFKALLNNLKSAALIENEHGEILYTNDLFCEYFKCVLSAEEIIGADAHEARKQAKLLFEEPDDFLDGIAKILEQRLPVYNERLAMCDGRILERDYVPIFVDGNYRGHLWKFNDVTSRVRYEDQLLESEERNRLILESALDAVVITNGKGNIEGWNPQAEELFGWTLEEVRGRNAPELLLPEDVRERQLADINEHLEGAMHRFKNQVMEMKAVHRNGRAFTVEVGLVSYRQHGSEYFVGFFKNIEARKFAERRLKKQEEKYRNIISDMNLGLLNIDLNHHIVYANQSFCDMTGYSREELLGSHTDMFKYDDSSKVIARSKMALSRQGISDTMEILARTKAGEMRNWFVSGGPTYNDRGEQTGAVVIYLDISDQKRLERELEIAKTAAERASEAKESFLANMSHEIRTPLNAIIGMIRELGREQLSPEQQTYLGHTDSAARHLLSIVNSILDISKIEAGELELDEHDFSLGALIANIQSILHMKAASKGLALECRISPDIWGAYYGDSARIRQVLINLLSNATKFTLEGGISLRADVLEETATTQRIRIEVADTGIGMDEAYLEEIFSKFSQAEKSTSRRFGGTGLGMSITKEIVRLMDGTIEVSSEKGVGTCFQIELTLRRGDIDKLILPTKDPSHRLRGARILLVEDNLMNRFIATKSLSHFGCSVDEAENGLVALDMLRQHAYDLVLMDIQMPELDGVATTKIIRAELGLDVPIVAVTANAFKKDIDLYLGIGMNDYVTKPFEEQALFDTLAKQLPQSSPSALPDAGYADGYDLRILRKLSHDDEAFVQKMVEVFVDTTPEAVRAIEAALKDGNYAVLAATAHRIKPSIESMGISQLAGVAKEIEVHAKSDSVDRVFLTERVRFFTGTLRAVIARIQEDEMAVE